MTAHIYECTINSIVRDIMFITLYGIHLQGRYFGTGTQLKAAAFITMIVASIHYIY